MKCALCLNEAPVVNSHVLPDFFFKRRKDAKGRLLMSGESSEKISLIQSVPKERLLCKQCDNEYFAALENYASGMIYGCNQHTAEAERIVGALVLRKFDYTRLKLFYLSLLWRMSVAKDEFFRQVDLGPYEEDARKMLLERNPGSPATFGIFCSFPQLEDESLLDATHSPLQARSISGKRGTSYILLIDGMLHYFFVGQHSIPDELKQFLLDDSGTWTMPFLKYSELPLLREPLSRLATAMRKRKARGLGKMLQSVAPQTR